MLRGVPYAQSVGQLPIQQSLALQKALAERRRQQQQAIARQAALPEQQRAAAQSSRLKPLEKEEGSSDMAKF